MAAAWNDTDIFAAHHHTDETIRELIRREHERNLEVETIRQALIEGEQSGEPEPFDFNAFEQRKVPQHG